jgi:hypothetical protein
MCTRVVMCACTNVKWSLISIIQDLVKNNILTSDVCRWQQSGRGHQLTSREEGQDCSSLKQDLPMQNVTGLDFHTSHTVVLHSTLTGFTPHTRSPGFQTQLFTCLLLLINLLGFTLFTEFHWILIWHCVVYWTKYIALYCYTGPEISLALNNIIVKSFSKISQFWRKYFHLNC